MIKIAQLDESQRKQAQNTLEFFSKYWKTRNLAELIDLILCVKNHPNITNTATDEALSKAINAIAREEQTGAFFAKHIDEEEFKKNNYKLCTDLICNWDVEKTDFSLLISAMIDANNLVRQRSKALQMLHNRKKKLKKQLNKKSLSKADKMLIELEIRNLESGLEFEERITDHITLFRF